MIPFRPTKIALDFDRTFTSDIAMWRGIVQLFVRRGHIVYLVTGRHDTVENRQLVMRTLGSSVDLFCDYVFCNHKSKRDTMMALGVKIDIWIDDLPEFVGRAGQDVFKEICDIQPVFEDLPVLPPNAVDSAESWPTDP